MPIKIKTNRELEKQEAIRRDIRAQEARNAACPDLALTHISHLQLLDITPFDPEDSINGEVQQLDPPDHPQKVVLTLYERTIKPEQVTEPFRTLLDSWRIRRTGWKDMAQTGMYRPYHYQLPTDASSSEANTPDVHSMDLATLAAEVYLHKDWTVRKDWTKEHDLAMPNTLDPERLLEVADEIRDENHFMSGLRMAGQLVLSTKGCGEARASGEHVANTRSDFMAIEICALAEDVLYIYLDSMHAAG